ncbi:MAG: nitrogen fixation protein NifZ [Nitrosomonadales bacterium]|nr:nitrogen fixation protein NifZ [Nitrosomonadales bacterium]
MLDIRQPKYQWSQPVTAAIDLVNDGSYPDAGIDALLVAAGTKGEIVQTGMHEESNMPVYIVEFSNGKVVGCLEDELAPV